VTPHREANIRRQLAEWREAGTAQALSLPAKRALRRLREAQPYSLTTGADQRLLATLADGAGKALEVGRFAGASTALLALLCERVVSLDSDLSRRQLVDLAPWHEAELDARAPGWGRLTDVATALLDTIGVADHCELVRGDSRQPETWPTARDFGLVFVDGDHLAQSCYSDLNHAWWRLAPGGVLAIHDYDLALNTNPTAGVDLAVDWWLARCEREGTAYDGPYAVEGSSIVWVRKETGP